MTLALTLGRVPTGMLFVVARGTAIALGLGTALLTARILGPEGRGALSSAIVLGAIGAAAAGIGLPAALYVRALRTSSGSAALAAPLVAWSGVVGLVAALGCLAILATGIVSLAPITLAAAAIGAGGVAIGLLLTSGATQLSVGTARPALAAAGLALPALAILAATAAAAIAARGPDAFLLAHAIGLVAAGLVLAVALGWRPRAAGAPIAPLLRLGRATVLGDLANVLAYRLDLLVVLALAGPVEAGVYALAVHLLEPMWVVATGTATSLQMAFRALPAGAWAARTLRTALLATTATVALVAGAIVVAPLVVELVGPGFEAVPGVMLLLAPGIAFLAASKVLAPFQVASGRLWMSSAVAALTVVVTTAGDLVLVPLLGARGAALAATIGYGASAACWLTALLVLRERPVSASA